jgi:phage tail-like protein
MPVNVDPLEDFSFQVLWGGTRIGMLRVSPLKWSTSVVNHRDGSNPSYSPQKAPGLTDYEPITLEREIAHDDLDFQNWANEVITAGSGGSGYKRDVVIQLLDGQHNPVVSFSLKNCWPSAYQAVTELNADASGAAIERLTIEYESFQRNDS